MCRAREDQNPAPAAASNTTLESGDAVRIFPYEQTPSIAVEPAVIADDFAYASPEDRAPAGKECVAYIFTVTDTEYERAVPGDVAAAGAVAARQQVLEDQRLDLRVG